MPRPDFLGIGAQRAGTTFLHTALASHPEIIMPRTGTDAWGKEQHFFNRFVLSSDLASYEAVFADPEKPAARIAGEITPAYAIMPRDLVGTVAHYLPNRSTRIIFIVRNPVDRIVSSFKQFHRIKGRPTGISWPARIWRFIAYVERPGVIRRTAYAKTVRSWTAAYGAERVLVVPFHSLECEPLVTLRRIAAFLGVDPDRFDEARMPKEKVYPSRGSEVPRGARAYVAWRWLPAMRRFNRRMNGALDPWIVDMEERTRKLGPAARALFSVARGLAWLRHSARRGRLARQLRLADARLRDLLAGDSSPPAAG